MTEQKRDLVADLEICQSIKGHKYRVIVKNIGPPFKANNIPERYVDTAIMGFGEVVSRAIAAEAELENLKGYIAMSEVNCTAAYNDLQQDRDVTKAKLFIAEEKQIATETEIKELKSTVAVLESLNNGLSIDCDELMTEVERLQKALKLISSSIMVFTARDIARKALGVADADN